MRNTITTYFVAIVSVSLASNVFAQQPRVQPLSPTVTSAAKPHPVPIPASMPTPVRDVHPVAAAPATPAQPSANSPAHVVAPQHLQPLLPLKPSASEPSSR